MNPPNPPPQGNDHTALLKETLQRITQLVAAAALLVALYLYFFTPNRLDVVAPVLITLFVATGWVLLRSGHERQAVHLVVFGVLGAATVASISMGSVRAAGVLLFLGAVVGAGIFTGRRTMLGTVFGAIALITALTLAEWNGWLAPRNLRTGPAALLTYIATLVVVALMVYYSRRRSEETMERLSAELDVRRQTERERDRSQDRLARFFLNSPSPMLAQSARTGTILDVNLAFSRCYGYTREQLLGRPDDLLWARPEERTAYLERLRRDRRTSQVSAQGVRGDGTLFDALVSSEMSDDPDDRLLITTVIDVTAQNEALERLRKSEERFAKAFNFSPLKMTITRLSDGQFIEVNQARDPVQGLGRQELIGRTTLQTGGWLSAEERQAFVRRLLTDGHVSGYETRMRHANGEVIDARMWAELIEIDGEQCVLSCFVNTTEEKRREAQLLALTRGMAGPSGDALFQALTMHMAQAIGADMVTVGEMRPDGCVRTLAVWKDGAAAPNYTYTPQGSPCSDTLALPGLNVVGRELEQRYAQYPALTDSGFQAYAGQTLRDEDGTPIGLLTAFWQKPVELPNDARALLAIFASRANAELVRLRRDREIQRLNSSLEERVRERTAELQKLNAELDSFAYSVSHDLKSPLRAIDGFTQLLKESLENRIDPQETELLNRVLASTHRMSTLIADLLGLARVSQGPLTLSEVDLSAMALSILRAEQERNPGRTLRWQIAPGLRVRCDERLARIALENLLGNAVKYARDRAETQIELGRSHDADGQAGELFLKDNGAGFDMAQAHRLFQPFQRLHKPGDGFEGTGIGLATVRRVLERHGGHIRGMSSPGQGATFHFSFGPTSSPGPRATPLSAPATT